jgi:hypothetical protein
MVAVCQLANVPRFVKVSLKAWAPMAPKKTPDAPRAAATLRNASLLLSTSSVMIGLDWIGYERSDD